MLTGNGFSNMGILPNIINVDNPSASFPPLGSLSPRNSYSTARGKLDPKDVVGELWQKYLMYQERLHPEIQADVQRSERELMRQEQDKAYKESLEKDRLKVCTCVDIIIRHN